MELRNVRPGDAVELPEGIFTISALTHCRAAAVEWMLWQLSGEGAEGLTLALIDGAPYRVQAVEAQELPAETALTVGEHEYRLKRQGEVRGERSSADSREFWLGQYRAYESGDRVLVFMEINGAIEAFSGEKMDPRLVSAFR